MHTLDSRPPLDPQPTTGCVAIAATFTAEPVRDVLAFWMEELSLPWSIEFAPYDQVFQQLLDPGSLLARNNPGVNVVLVRVEDWQRSRLSGGDRVDLEDDLTRTADDLIGAVQAMVVRSSTPLLVGLCPAAPAATAVPESAALFSRIEARITAAMDGIPGVGLIRSADFAFYPVKDYHDPQRDQLGHIPYTPPFFASLGTILSRRIYALTSPPHKVIVLDCDNTLWKGVVGEEGVVGITIPPAWKRLQQFLVDRASQGFLLCLCSKNEEADVLEVFERRADMILKRDHLVSWRINWRSKSENIRALAGELNLGLDSFIFLDDNPVECAEVRAGCPEVLTLRLPIEGDMVRFLEHVWAFDRLHVTTEDRQRTTLYQQEAERTRFQKQAPTIEEFVAGLDLQVEISEPAPAQLSRVAQLTQRTNQFNFTTRRRTDAEIQRLSETGLECRAVEVSDRFGDYGLVGVLIFASHGDALEVDTFLLSCRVLGRGVEHRMLNELGQIARQRGLSRVEAVCIPTQKNQPARDFIERVAAEYRLEIDEEPRYRIPAEQAATIAYIPESARPEANPAAEVATPTTASPPTGRVESSQRFERIAAELSSPEQVLATLRACGGRPRPRAAIETPFVAPRTEIEATLAEIWAGLLRLDSVGIRDRFFDLGGTSLLAVDLFAQIERRFNKKLPLTSLLEAPAIEQLAPLVTGGPRPERDHLVQIRDGGQKPPLFLVHDGDGETMLYRNLALLLKPDHAVFGLQPRCRENVPMAHTRITEMAVDYVDRIRSVQPEGPYLLGGMCAGGVIAFEVARQLQGQGEKVAMVALIDAADIEAPPKPWRFAQQRAQRFATVFHQEQPVPLGRRALTVLAKAVRKVRNLTTYLARLQFESLRDEIRMRLFRYHLDRGLRLPRILEQIPVRTVYLFAEKSYRPEGRFDGRLVLFRATSGEGADEPYIQRYDDPLFGWGRRSTQGVAVYDIAGGHSSMLQEPNVHVLARLMQDYLDKALADEPAAELAAALADT
jgi:FkbH-like protein